MEGDWEDLTVLQSPQGVWSETAAEYVHATYTELQSPQGVWSETRGPQCPDERPPVTIPARGVE